MRAFVAEIETTEPLRLKLQSLLSVIISATILVVFHF